jgi:hypothetical protein
MNIGIFYQSGHKLVPCYMALQQLRKIYPDVPIALYEDGSYLLENVAKEFNCFYERTEQSGANDKYSGRAVKDLESNINFLKRAYTAQTTLLKNVEWVIFYEDDVWCRRKIEKKPKFDLNGSNGPLYTKELYEYLKNRFNVVDDSRSHWSSLGTLESYQSCGGTIWNRKKFINAYEQIDNIDWNLIKTLDSRPCEWADASISFIMQHAGNSCGIWDDWGQYDSDGVGQWFNKTGWTKPMSKQKDVAFLHLYKHFYNYNNDELELAKTKIVI